MNLVENIREGLRSVAGNQLRAILTAAIIAIGITSLVGILTAIDGIQSSVSSSFEDLGSNTFNINTLQDVGRRDGRVIRQGRPITYREAMRFSDRFRQNGRGSVTVSLGVTGTAQIKYGSKKTNPNVGVTGIDGSYLAIQNYKLGAGRPFSETELSNALNVAIIGGELAQSLFGRGVDPINKSVRALGVQYNVVGVLEKKGGVTGGEADRVVLIPLDNARTQMGAQTPTFDIRASVASLTDQEMAMEEARGLMRQVRRDALGQPDSFEITRADDIAQEIEDITGYLRIGGFGIGFITLLGASIALLNIMLVSVTERTREIGIRKSLGATPRRIRQQFLIEAIVICLLGGLGGIVLGLGIGNLIASVVSDGEGGFVVPWVWMGLGVVVCVVVGLFSGLYPAVRASRLDPIEALRYE